MQQKELPSPQLSEQKVLSPALRRYLYFTAAITGAAILVVEILGAKMLSPFVGTSHFVWTAQIAVTLVALACGYYAGGRVADGPGKLCALYWAIFAAGVYLGLTVLICQPVAYWCLDFNLALGSLLASAILFFVPLALLATVGPCLVRSMASSVEVIGRTVGRLTAVSTLGSFIGTIAIGYLVVPLLPNSVSMYLTALALLLLSLGYLAIFRGKFAWPLALAIGFAAPIGLELRQELHSQFEWVIQQFRGNSHFGEIQVIDRRDKAFRYYLNDYLIQNTYDPELRQSRSAYTYLLSGLARAYTSNINDVLCIGLGVGIVPMDFALGGARVDAVEINPAVVPVAERFFDLQPDKLNLILDDGRHFLNRCHRHYDAVILDAFLGDSSPSHLLTREAFMSIRALLQPGGALVINAFGHLQPGRDFFICSLNKTLKAVFPSVRIHSTGDGGMFLVATDRSPMVIMRPPSLEGIHPDVLTDAKLGYETIVDIPWEHGRILTDDYNPVEFYDARNRELLRRKLALDAKTM